MSLTWHTQQRVAALEVKQQYLNHLTAGSFQNYLVLSSTLSLREEDFLALPFPPPERLSLQKPQKVLLNYLAGKCMIRVFLPHVLFFFLITYFFFRP